ncbi:MAG: site-specific integrase [Chitinophagaceae bacterium]
MNYRNQFETNSTKSNENTKSVNSFRIYFYIKKYKELNGKLPIYARITVNKQRAEFSIKRTIEEKNWNSAKGLAKGNKEEVKSLNHYLEQIRASIVTDYQEMVLSKKLITAQNLRLSFQGGKRNERTLCTLMEFHNETMNSVLEPGTLKNYFTTTKYVQKFLLKNFRVPDIALADINYRFITEFEIFLRRHQPLDHQKKSGNNGAMKHLERLRKMMGLAYKMEWIFKNPFEQYSLKFYKYERGCLNEEELKRIENKAFEIPRLNWIRDLFVFSCYTGLAYCDTMKLTPAHINRGIDNEGWLITSRQKGGEQVKVPLLQKASEIINKYKTDPKAVSQGKLFPRISN